MKFMFFCVNRKTEYEMRMSDWSADVCGSDRAFRSGVELVAALIVGVGIGWLLDSWLGTGPWLFILFFMLGAAAGMLNVWRTVEKFGRTSDGGTDESG